MKEEIGLIGATEIDQEFLEGVDCAIVVNRRGNRDIVTFYADTIAFCPEGYGKIFEQAGVLAGMDDWKITAGGSSDARFFSEYGIPSVTLSISCIHEHTKEEVVDYLATYETLKLIEGVLHGQICECVEGSMKELA